MKKSNILISSLNEFKRITTIAVSGMLSAVNVVLHLFLTIPVSNFLELRFSFLAVAVTGFLYGPIVGGLMGAVGDILKYVVRPTGAFFPGFTLSEFVTGFVYGLFFYKKKITLLRTICAQAVVSVVVSLGLTPLWLHIMYGDGFIAIVAGRIVTTLVMFPVYTALLFAFLKLSERVFGANRK